jgi:predicted enzyme related to lactoylglutathione lyase
MLKKVAFTMYPVSDVARARRFYEEALGLKVGLNGNQGDKWWIEYDLPGGGCLALANFTGKADAGSGGTIAFEVEDLDALISDLTAKGAQFAGAIVQGPRCRMITCLDSEGNAIILHELNAEG